MNLSKSKVFDSFKNKISGNVILKNDKKYDDCRKVLNRILNKYPLAIIQCRNVSDIIESVKFAQKNRFLVSVKATGHNVTGSAVCENGLVIDLSLMKSIYVNPIKQIALAESGLTWGEFDTATQKFNLATPGGVESTTGIVGVTLGGGVGWLSGKHGLCCDNLLSADVITANGQLITANEIQHKDLLWGLKGGGGNLGIVSSLQFQLFPLNQIYAGSIIISIEQATDALQKFKNYCLSIPNELTISAALMFVDAEPILSLDFCYSGEAQDGKKVLDPLIATLNYTDIELEITTYVAWQKKFDNPIRRTMRSYWKSTFLSDLSTDAIDTTVINFLKSPSQKSIVFIEYWHGRIKDTSPLESAFGNRTHEFNLLIVSNWPDENEDAINMLWAKSFYQDMIPYAAPSVYANYLDHDDLNKGELIFGKENFKKLQKLKAKYDPNHFFGANVGI